MPSLHPRTILIVEDSEECAFLLELAVQSLPGCQVHCVAAAEDALHFLAARRAAALITDLNLPDASGFELIERVRSHPDFARLPLLVVSGDTDPRTPDRVLALGADAYFVKPFSPSELRNRLEQLIHAD
jgi:DNA-binding response OmpR family regulator